MKYLESIGQPTAEQKNIANESEEKLTDTRCAEIIMAESIDTLKKTPEFMEALANHHFYGPIIPRNTFLNDEDIIFQINDTSWRSTAQKDKDRISFSLTRTSSADPGFSDEIGIRAGLSINRQGAISGGHSSVVLNPRDDTSVASTEGNKAKLNKARIFLKGLSIKPQ